MKYLLNYSGILTGLILVFSTGVLAETQADMIKFSHKLHLENEVECSVCHQKAIDSPTGSDNLMPVMDACSDCHDISDDAGCGSCHTNTDEPGEISRITTYSAIFSHRQHISSGLTCLDCHTGIDTKEASGTGHLPSMTQCQDCHSKKSVRAACTVCHSASEDLLPRSHKNDFFHTHGQMARSNGKDMSTQMTCSACHQDNYCQDCHEGENVTKNIHPLNFEFTHSFKARNKEQDCMTCHTERMFCVECHSQNLIMPFNHGIGWINSIPGDGGFHKNEAKIDLESCMVCHEKNAVTICQPCHGN